MPVSGVFGPAAASRKAGLFGPAGARPVPREWPYLLAGLALALGLFSFVYRFNALGGALGGFDDDHFIYFVQARQMLHGERPLRDFADAGLQGAWPWPTYALSLAGQRWVEPTLWPEGLLGVTAIALAVVVTFLAGTRVAPVWAALTTALLTLLLGTKLYNYPRAVVLAVAVLLMTYYARRPSAKAAAALAVWGVVAFLFRHDFGVYVGIGAMVLILAAHRIGDWRVAVTHLGISGALAATLVVPSLVVVERDRGLVRYFQTGLEMSRREKQRTTLRLPQFVATEGPVAGALSTEENAVAWLFYGAWGIPLLAVVSLRRLQAPGFDERRFHALIVSLAVVAALLDYSFLRGNIGARLGDLGAPIAVLAAILMQPRAVLSYRHAAIHAAVWMCIIVATTASVFTVGSVAQELDTTGLSDSWEKVRRRYATAQAELRALPGDGSATVRIPPAAAFLRACTRPEDRVMVAGSDAATIVLADRRFAGGHSTFTQGFYGSEDEQRETIERLRTQSVPVVIAEDGDDYHRYFEASFRPVYNYLQEHYRVVGRVGAGAELRQVLVLRTLLDGGSDRPSALDPATGLPCFR